MRKSFRKEERLSGTKRSEQLFTHGQSFIAYPLRVVFMVNPSSTNTNPLSVMISVPKKKLKLAVDRNRTKRLMREAFRLNKHLFDARLLPENCSIDLALVYLKNELSDYTTIEKAVRKALNEITLRMKDCEQC